MSRFSVLLCVLSFVSQLVSASPVTEKSWLDTLQIQPDFRSSFGADPTPPPCAVFTGSWKGVCVAAAGKKTDQSVTVEQLGCEVITAKDAKHTVAFVIGGVQTASGAAPGISTVPQTAPAFTYGGTLETHWNKDKTVVTLEAVAGVKALTADAKGEGFALLEKMRLVGGKLIVDVYAKGDEHRKIEFCELDKQP